MIQLNMRSTCLSCRLVWGAWYLQSRLTRCRRTGLRRVHSGPAWRVPLLRPRGPRHLRRKGEEPSLPTEFLLRRPRLDAEPHSIDGQHGHQGRLDSRPQRGRGAAARSTPGSRSTTRGSTSSTATTSPIPGSPVTVSEKLPRVMVGQRRYSVRATRYFGPYSHAWAIRETVDLLLRVFPHAFLPPRRIQEPQATWAGLACSAISASARLHASAG